jgi:XTP/dITP diphosphohydrolase
MPQISGKLVIATHNAGKLREIAALLAPYGLDCVSAGALGLPEPAETGTSFAENALIKAHGAAKASSLPALADDSGLCVDALGGRPGVYTADWAERQWFEGPAGRDWYLAMGKVEGLLAEQGPHVDRSCHFACVLAIAWPDGTSVVYEGRAEGSVTWPPRGTVGFGYDPVFVPRGGVLTFAELDPEEKHRISHRADAFAKLVADQFAA